MRKILRLFFAMAMMLILLPPSVQAQTKTVTGTIVSEDNKTPLRGVTVRVKGTRRIVQTDANGAFTISVNPGDVLQFSYVGFQPTEVKPDVDGVTLGISMKPADNTMGEVVVTAMDIRRNARELGYSTQKVGGKDIAETQRENFLNALQGRVAGLMILPTSGQAGASSEIVLRGFNSMSLSNQPIFVLDGVIIDNNTINETSNGGTGIGLASDRPNRNNDYTNRIADINPNDIEQVTVLKGPEATALYGSQASSGAIIITTKKATTGKVTFAYDNSFRARSVNRFVETNNVYGFGTNGTPPTTTTHFSPTSGSYFGPKYPTGTKHYDNIDAFFRTGFAQTHNISADAGSKNIGGKITGSYFKESGVLHTNEYSKYNARFTGTAKVGKWLEFYPSVQYIQSKNDKPIRSAGGYMLGLYAWPTTNDISTFTDIDGNKISILSADPYSEIDNPLYNINKNHSQDKTKRWIFSGSLNINPLPWLSLQARVGFDTYKSTGYTFYHPLSNLTTRTQLGALDNYWRNFKGYNHTITATVKKTIGKWTGRLMAGTMWQDNKTEMFAIFGVKMIDSVNAAGKMMKNGQILTDANFDQLVGSPTDSGITTPSSRVRLLRNNVGEFNRFITRNFAYFGEVFFSYDNKLFLSYTHRFEESSIFPKANRNYNYPGVSFSAILSDIFPTLKGKFINYWKLRASRASTARLADPYKNQSVFVNNFTSSNVGQIYSYGFDNNNPGLKPERQRTYEFGMELKMFNGFLMLDATYYRTRCTDQISNQFRASYATGFVLNTQNAASLINRGVEFVVDLNLMRGRGVNWNSRLNFNRGWSSVLTLPEAIAFEYYIADTWLYNNARGGMIRGMPATTITGFHYMRNLRGDILINPTTGLPVVEGTFTVIGDRMPKFTLGWLNNFRYKDWSLSFLWDLKVGGDVFNATDMYLTRQGKSQRTADRETPRIINGVLQDGNQNSATPTANTIVVVPYFNQDYYVTMPEEEFVQKNVNWFKLRDITLNYSLPQRMLSGMKIFQSLGVFLTGNDLVLFTNYRGADPSVNGNTASGLGVGAFGFDYGSLGTGSALNFGIKAIFK